MRNGNKKLNPRRKKTPPVFKRKRQSLSSNLQNDTSIFHNQFSCFKFEEYLCAKFCIIYEDFLSSFTVSNCMAETISIIKDREFIIIASQQTQ